VHNKSSYNVYIRGDIIELLVSFDGSSENAVTLWPKTDGQYLALKKRALTESAFELRDVVAPGTSSYLKDPKIMSIADVDFITGSDAKMIYKNSACTKPAKLDYKLKYGLDATVYDCPEDKPDCIYID
jgi:hypothetical protein